MIAYGLFILKFSAFYTAVCLAFFGGRAIWPRIHKILTGRDTSSPSAKEALRSMTPVSLPLGAAIGNHIPMTTDMRVTAAAVTLKQYDGVRLAHADDSLCREQEKMIIDFELADLERKSLEYWLQEIQ